MHSRLLTSVFALIITLALVGCGGGGGGGGGGGAGPGNLAPFLGCVKGVITAGGARILVTWDEATDDNDAASAIRYQVFLSATSGGHNFAAPTTTTVPGATSIQLTSGNSPLIAVGSEVFVVVRAVDSAGAVNTNRAECSCTCVPTGSVAYVNPAAAGPGALGDPADPFTTLQAGIDAVPAAGGAVLCAEGAYTALTAATDAGVGGSTLGIYGGFAAASFTAGASATSLLAANDPAGTPSVLNGVGLDPTSVVGQIGHLDIRNMGRRTYLGTFSFLDNEAQPLVAGVDVNIVVTCCSFNDPVPDTGATPEPSEACQFSESAPTASQRVAICGCFFDNVNECLELSGGFAEICLSGNRAEDSAWFLFASSAAIPAGAAWRFHMDCNDLTRLSSAALRLNAVPEVNDGAGSKDIRICGNRIVAINSSNDLDGYGSHGTGGTFNFLIEDNFIGPVDSDSLRLELLPNVAPDDEFLTATITNFTVRNNDFVLWNSDCLEVDDIEPRAGGTFNYLVEDCAFVQGDQETLEWDPGFPGTASFSQDGATQSVIVRRCTTHAVDGFIDSTQRLFRAGSSTCLVHDCMLDGNTDEPCDLDLENFSTAVTAEADDTAHAGMTFRDNVVYGTDESSLEVLDLDLDVQAPGTYCRFTNNVVYAGEESIDATFSFDGGTGAALDFVCEGNDLRQADDDNILDIDHDGASPGVVYARICNNFMRSGRDVIEYDNFSAMGGVVGFVSCTHNYFSDSTEGETVDFSFSYGTWSVLIARNLVLGGGDDGEEAFEVGASDTVAGADYLIRNNVAFASGGGIEADDSFHALQMINNTVAFSGQGFNPIIGSDNGGVNSPVYVHNCVIHGTEEEDVPVETIATYSIFEHPLSSAGVGSILGDPVFRRAGTINTPNTWLQLSTASPARNAGDPSTIYNDPDGTRNDMGAFGGPGAGPVGALASLTTPCPLYLVGFDPLLHLHAGASLLPSGVTGVDCVFTHDIDAATANAGTLTFAIGGVPVAGAYAVTGRRVTFTPTAAWPASAEVTVTVGTGLRNTAGTAHAFQDVRSFAIAPAGATAEAEANDASGTANALAGTAVETVSGTLSSDADIDFYSFAGTVGERLQVSLFGDRPTPSPIEFRMRLYAADGTTVLFDNTSALQNSDPFIDFTLPTTGTYFVEVLDDASGAGAGPFPYTLQIWRR